jgi:hypothetical protein
MFISCTMVHMGLLWSLVMSSSGLYGSQDCQYAVAAPLVQFFLFSLRYQQILQKRKIRKTSLNNVLNCALFDVLIAYNLSHYTPAARSLETMTGFEASC